MVAETVVVLQSVPEHEFGAFFGRLPPRCYHAAWGLALEVFDQLVAFVHYSGLLLYRHGDGVFMRVACHTLR